MPTDLPPLPELLPCPFCGARAEPFKPSRGNGMYVGCTGCHGSVFACPLDLSKCEAEAVAAWNRRAFGHACRVVTLSEVEREAIRRVQQACEGRMAGVREDFAIVCAAIRRLGGSP